MSGLRTTVFVVLVAIVAAVPIPLGLIAGGLDATRAAAQQRSAEAPRADTDVGEKSDIERWAPVAANAAAVITMLVAVAAGFVAFRKYVGARVFRPRIWIELQGAIVDVEGGSAVAVNMTLENKGVRTVVVRGANSRQADQIWSYVSVIPMSQDRLHAPETSIVWRATDELAVLLGEQRDPPQDIRLELTPDMKTEFPFLIPIIGKPVAAKVAAQVYVEDIRGGHGDYHHAEKVL
jgi:hypothetical protein